MGNNRRALIAEASATAKESIEILYQNGLFDEVKNPNHPLFPCQHRLIKAINGIVSLSKPRKGKGGRKV